MRNYDCFSETYNLGYELMNWYDAFRHNFFKDLSGVVYAIVAAVHIFGGIRWWSVCSSEMNYGLSNPFTKLLGSVSSVTDTKTGFETMLDIVYELSIVFGGFSAYKAYERERIWTYNLSRIIVTSTTTLIMFIDKVASLGMIIPLKPWVRNASSQSLSTWSI